MGFILVKFGRSSIISLLTSSMHFLASFNELNDKFTIIINGAEDPGSLELRPLSTL